MTAAFKKGQYFHDDPTEPPLIVKVEADHFANAELGWTAPDPGTERTGYGSTTPRRVHGVNITPGVGGVGFVTRRASVVVPDTTADAWLTTTATFTDKDQDGTVVTYTVTSRVGEVRRFGM